MKVRNACLSMGLATGLGLIAATGSALAADMGGIKDYGGAGGVPVPAPVPIAVMEAEWYIGIAAGGVLSDNSSIETTGSLSTVDTVDKTMFGGISAGRYLTPSLRAEFAFDFYDDFHITNPSEFLTTDTRTGESTVTTPAGAPTYDTQHYDVTRTDTVKVGRTTGMFNVFYDLPTGSRFRPYVGAGIGVSWRQIKHRYSVHGVCDHTTNPGDANIPAGNCVRTTDDMPAEYTENGENTVDNFNVALAAMAGFSMEVTPDIFWDNGYQMLWENGTVTAESTCGSCTTTISYGDTIQHQFRTGLRFNVN